MKNIVLVGLMGAGKSTVGKQLAIKLNYNFLDTDEYIEKQENRKISEIFQIYGEEYFRNLENNVSQYCKLLENTVISTGGGFVQNKLNMDNLKTNSFVVYLQACENVLYERIKSDNSRPLLQTENPLMKLKELLKIREQNYKLANKIINTENMNADEITDEILREYYEKN